ncbi:MAG: hypothetical protein AB2A00_05275 [Myxococcota bacterium]
MPELTEFLSVDTHLGLRLLCWRLRLRLGTSAFQYRHDDKGEVAAAAVERALLTIVRPKPVQSSQGWAGWLPQFVRIGVMIALPLEHVHPVDAHSATRELVPKVAQALADVTYGAVEHEFTAVDRVAVVLRSTSYFPRTPLERLQDLLGMRTRG